MSSRGNNFLLLLRYGKVHQKIIPTDKKAVQIEKLYKLPQV